VPDHYQYVSRPLDGYEPAVGAALWRMEDTRERTISLIDRITDEAVDWVPPWGDNTIGTLIYHLAIIELDWLYTEILDREPPAEFLAFFAVDARDDAGALSTVQGETFDTHLARFHAVRARVMYSLRDMTADGFHRVRFLGDYDVKPEWVIHHLNQHEAERRGQIGEVALAGGFLRTD